jgi:hypothetical protein
MIKTDRFLSLLVCASFGFVGGIASNLAFFNTRAAAAQQTSIVVRAQSFEVVNKQGERVGELGLNDVGRAELRLNKDGWPWNSTLNDHSLSFVYDNKQRLGMGVFLSRTGPAGASINIDNERGVTTWTVK